MKITITDACIFIDLFELNLLSPFFSLEIEVHTSVDVLNEMNDLQKGKLTGFKHSLQLTVHSLTSDELTAMNAAGYPKALSNSDKTVLFIAEHMGAVLLSSDKLVRNTAKNKGIDYHGLLWVIDQLKDQRHINTQEAIEKLSVLKTYNFYKNNSQLLQEMNKRLKEWQQEN